MKKKLIIVADDYGFSEAYNYGALKAYQEGVVTVLSLMSNMDAAEHAISLVRDMPNASIVQHTNLVQGKPVSNPDSIPSLVNEQGMFYRSYLWKSEYDTNKNSRGIVSPTYEDCKIETLAQLDRFKALTGSYPNHFEGHSVGTKAIQQAFRELSEELHIHSVGLEEIESDELYPVHELAMSVPSYREILHRGVCVEDFLEDRFQLLTSPFEINALHFHPGYLDQYILDNTSLTIPRCKDLQTLCDSRVKEWLNEHEIELTDYSVIYKKEMIQ